MDVMEIRRQARAHIDKGAVTDTYGCDRETVIKLLNSALATELLCTLRYKRHYYMAQGIHAQSVQQEFLEHANQEAEHAGWLAERIVELGGAPDFNPATITARSHAEYVEGTTLLDMIEEDLVAERIAIDSYRAIVQYLGNGDSSSRRIMERILEVEEEHAEDMLTLLQNFNAREPVRKAG